MRKGLVKNHKVADTLVL
jgi:hypothetical protein